MEVIDTQEELGYPKKQYKLEQPQKNNEENLPKEKKPEKGKWISVYCICGIAVATTGSYVVCPKCGARKEVEREK